MLRLIGLLAVLSTACSGEAKPARHETAPASAAPATAGAQPTPPAPTASAEQEPPPRAASESEADMQAAAERGEVVVDGRMKLIVAPSKDPYGQAHQKALSRKDRGFDKIVTLLDKMFVLPRPIPVVFRDCGRVNAFYMGSAKGAAIHMCYELLKDFDEKAKKSRPDWSEKERMLYVVSNIFFVFLHEFGHALHHELKLPITGKGEDAADELATLLILQSEKGESIAQAAAMGHQMSAKARADAGAVPAYYDEHSLSEQRFYSILCMMYGAQPDKYGRLLAAHGVDTRRMAMCRREYQDKQSAWTTLLKPHAAGAFNLSKPK